jgi:alcohol dehydrogenase
MNAAVYHSFGGPIRVETVSRPTTAPSEGVIIQVMASGVCRSDWHGWKGHDSDIIQHGLPFCPGHECSGIVVHVGAKVQRMTRGDRVAVPFILSCGTCRFCAPPHCQPTICKRQQQPGFTQWGSYAEYLVIPHADRNLRILPDAVSFVQAAALGCRFTTAYRAVVQQGRLGRGGSSGLDRGKEKSHRTSNLEDEAKVESIAIFGCGGVGLSCIMIAAALAPKNCRIIAIDVSLAALDKSRSLGATHTVQVPTLASKDDVSATEEEGRATIKQQLREQVCRLTREGDGADLSIDAAGFAATSEHAVWCTRPGGRMVQVGLPIGHGVPEIPMGRVVGKELELVGSHGFAATDLLHLLDMVAQGQLDPSRLVEREVSLTEGCRVLEAMDHSSPLGIVVITDFEGDSSPYMGASGGKKDDTTKPHCTQASRL